MNYKNYLLRAKLLMKCHLFLSMKKIISKNLKKNRKKYLPQRLILNKSLNIRIITKLIQSKFFFFKDFRLIQIY